MTAFHELMLHVALAEGMQAKKVEHEQRSIYSPLRCQIEARSRIQELQPEGSLAFFALVRR
jgi:hypothetical protein